MKATNLWNKNFTLVVIGQIISLFGNGILRFALPLYLLNLTGSSALFGMVSAVSLLPLVFLMPIGGIVADRQNKRNIMVVLDFCTGLLIVFFYVTQTVISIVPLLIATLMILYSIGGLYQPTVQASVPALLDESILVQGNGIVSSISALANLAAPAIGGLLLGKFGMTPILLVSIFCFFASAVLEIFIQIPHNQERSKSSMLQIVKADTKASMGFIFKDKPTLRKLVCVICILNGLISALVMISLPVFISQRLNLSDEMYGCAQAVLALGGLFGGIMVGVIGEKLRIQNLYRYIVFIALSLIPMAISMMIHNALLSYGLILASAFLAMCCSTLASVMIITYIQSQTVENMIGKIMAFIMTASTFASPFGQAIYGIAFEFLMGYDGLIVFGAVILSLLVSLYAKKIYFDD